MIPKSKLSEYVSGEGMHSGQLTQIPVAPSYAEPGNPQSEWHPMQGQSGLTAATNLDYIEVPKTLLQKLEDCHYCASLVIEKQIVTGPDEVPVYNENGTFTWTHRELAEGETYEYDVLVDVIPNGYVFPEPVQEPSETEVLKEKVAAMEDALTATQMALCDMYEANL